MANTLEIVIKAKDQASHVIRGVGDTLGGLGDIGVKAAGMVATAAAGVVTAVAGAAAAGIKLAVDALPAAGVMAAFEGVADDAAGMLQALRDASSGMATDVELMKNYNLAALLVGETFADQLPDAMGYLQKVSAATGTTMEYQMDSLVRGVGRLSPLILDNLGVSLKLEDAYATYAQTIGKTVDELSREEQQAAVMAEVMRQLADSTADMPDISDQQKAWTGLGTAFQNLKTNIGLALGPALVAVVEPLAGLLERLAPYADDIAAAFSRIITNNVAPILERIAQAISEMFAGNTQGALEALFGEELGARIYEIASAIGEFITKVATFVSEHKDGFIGAIEGIAAVLAGGMIYNAIMAIVAAITAIGLPVIAVIAAVGALAYAWSENWGGIRTWTTKFWHEDLVPFAETVVSWFERSIPEALSVATAWWQDKLLPALRSVWLFFETYFLPVLQALYEVHLAALNLAVDALTMLWNAYLLPALQAVWEFITASLVPSLSSVWSWISEQISPALGVVTTATELFQKALEALKGAIGWVIDKLHSLRDALNRARDAINANPAMGHSPSPFEVALRGIGSAMHRITAKELPAFNKGMGTLSGWSGGSLAMAGMARMQLPQMVSASQRGMATAGNRTINQTYNLIVNTNAATEPIIADFNMLRAMAG